MFYVPDECQVLVSRGSTELGGRAEAAGGGPDGVGESACLEVWAGDETGLGRCGRHILLASEKACRGVWETQGEFPEKRKLLYVHYVQLNYVNDICFESVLKLQLFSLIGFLKEMRAD